MTKHWSMSEDQILLEGLADGLNDQQLAGLLPGRTRDSVKQRRARGDLESGNSARQPWSSADVKTLHAMLEEGNSDADIADVLGRSAQAVKVYRNQRGLKRAYTAEQSNGQSSYWKRIAADCDWLIDAMIAEGHAPGQGELVIPSEGRLPQPMRLADVRSYCGSSAAMCEVG